MAGPLKYGFCDKCQSRYLGESCPFCRARAVNEPAEPANIAEPEPANAPANKPQPANKRERKPANKPGKDKSASPVPGYMAGQYKDADRRREYQRDLMRRKREAERAAK